MDLPNLDVNKYGTYSVSYIHWQFIYTSYHRWIHDMRANVEFQIQILHICHSSNADSVHTVGVETINPLYI